MKKTIDTEKIPIQLWLDDIEVGALEQARNLANLPFAFSHVSIMPDAHQGYGMPIGGVLATKGVVIPNAVGVDIGCGMRAVRTNLTQLDQKDIKSIFGGSKEHHGGIRSVIPVGPGGRHSKKQDESLMPIPHSSMKIVNKEYNNALKQLGTLGGGNHFIEIQKGSDGFIWIMVHSGSRNIGFKTANHYNEVANTSSYKWDHEIPVEWELAYLPLDSEEGQAYLAEMQYCVEFATANRRLMIERIKMEFSHAIGHTVNCLEFDNELDVPHNYAVLENHYGTEVMIHRKGATRAFKGELGIIPGSQGTSSYIVCGKGNLESFQSCSHGAGRKMSRAKAKKTLDLQAEIEHMNKQGILHGMRGKKNLDEAAGAYKDIYIVMDNQKDLVKIVMELKPLAVIKG